MADPCEAGLETIDAEHSKLVNLFDAFARCIKEGAPVAETYDIVRETIKSTNEHFEHEERIIDESRYPNAEDHKLLHRHLRMQLATLMGHTANTGVDDQVTAERLFEIRRLIVEHIQGPDGDLEEYLRKSATC